MNWIIIVQGLLLIGLALCILGLWRNNQVKKFVDLYLEEEDAFIIRRVKDGKGFDTFRRYNALPDYYTMVFRFWEPLNNYHRPLSEFYND
jgi:hypothetical protein